MPVEKVEIYTFIDNVYYRLLSQKGLTRTTPFDLDIPDCADNLVILADGVRYDARPGDKVTVNPQKKGSRAEYTDENGLGEGAIVNPTVSWLIVAEDLGISDDFDFNDVIVEITTSLSYLELYVEEQPWVKYPEITVEDPEVASRAGTTASRAFDPESKVTITAMAAGGTIPVYLHYNDGTTDYVLTPDGAVPTKDIHPAYELDYEWHKWFGDGNLPYGKMLNTTPENRYSTKTLTLPASFLGEDFTFANYSRVDDKGRLLGFYITVDGLDADPMTFNPARPVYGGQPGVAPQMFLIPDIGATHNGHSYWEWPSERSDILRCYGRFKDWVGDHTITDWHIKKNLGADCYER